MSTAAQSLRPRKTRRWLKWIGLALFCFALALAGLYVYLFVRIAPTMSVEVVDALTHKPLPNMDVCLQVVASGMGHKQALRSDLLRTDTKGEVFFEYSIHDLPSCKRGMGTRFTSATPKVTSVFPVDRRLDSNWAISLIDLGTVVLMGHSIFRSNSPRA
jgi:hypothetical protein